MVSLQPQFWVERKYNVRGKEHVCQVTTEGRKVVVAADDEKILHLFSFFIRIQCRIRDDLEGEFSLMYFIIHTDNDYLFQTAQYFQ